MQIPAKTADEKLHDGVETRSMLQRRIDSPELRSRRWESSILSEAANDLRDLPPRAAKRSRINYAESDTDDQTREEDEEIPRIPNHSRRRLKQKQKQKIISDDTDDDEEGNFETVARMRRQLEAEAVQQYAQAASPEQAADVSPNPRLQIRVPAVKIEATDLTGDETRRPLKTERRNARRAQAKSSTMTASELRNRAILIDLQMAEAKLRRERFEVKMQLEKAEREGK